MIAWCVAVRGRDSVGNRAWRTRCLTFGSNHFGNGAYHRKTPRSSHARKVSGMGVATKVVESVCDVDELLPRCERLILASRRVIELV